MHYGKLRRHFVTARDSMTAGRFKFGGFIWIQGERDAQDVLGGADSIYETNLGILHAAVQSDFGTAPFIVSQLSSGTPAWTYKTGVTGGQTAFGASHARVSLVNTDSLALEVDNTHYTADAYEDLGSLLATAVLAPWGY
jgi:hypothetical protein